MNRPGTHCQNPKNVKINTCFFFVVVVVLLKVKNENKSPKNLYLTSNFIVKKLKLEQFTIFNF